MNKIICTMLLCFISLNSICANSLDGVFGLRFGCSRESAKQVMLKKADFPIDKINSRNDCLIYGSGTFAGNEIESLFLYFIDNKLYSVIFFISPDLESNVIRTYNKLQKDLNSKYYKSEDIMETYDYPYESGDGFAEAAIKLGKARFATKWFFENPSNNEIRNFIILGISNTMDVALYFNDGALQKIVTDRENEKNMKDY